MTERPLTNAGQTAFDAIVASPGTTLVAVDFDGTLAPIVDDPANAVADPAAVQALSRLGGVVGAVVVITGRPAETAVRLGGFEGHAGLQSMVVLGQYGVERWNADGDDYVIPPEPPEIAAVAAEIPAVLTDLGLSDARIEHKGRAVGVHTRQLPEPAPALRQVTGPLTELADRYGLQTEPGKNVLEIRAAGFDKGDALEAIIAELGMATVVFAGDDLGDRPAFELIRAKRSAGALQGLLVCVKSWEEDALVELADVVVDGTSGVAAWLNELAEALGV